MGEVTTLPVQIEFEMSFPCSKMNPKLTFYNINLHICKKKLSTKTRQKLFTTPFKKGKIVCVNIRILGFKPLTD